MKRPGGFDEEPSDSSKPGAPRNIEQKSARRLLRRPLRRAVTSSAESQVRTQAQAPAGSNSLVDSVSELAETIDLSEVRERALDARHDAAADVGVQRAEADLKRAQRERRGRERREQRRFTEHLRVRRRRVLVVASVILGLALFVLVGVFTPIMAVREVQVQGAQAVNAEQLQQALSRFEGVPLALVSDQDVHRAIESFPLIQRYAVERIPPHTLIVRIEERTAVIAMEREGGFDLLDPAGVLLGRVAERPAGVPLGSPELTDIASPAFLAAANIVRDMPDDLRQQLVSVRASNAQDVSFTLASGTEVLWGEAKETQRKSVVLRSMIASIGAPSLIDVSAPEAPVFK